MYTFTNLRSLCRVKLAMASEVVNTRAVEEICHYLAFNNHVQQVESMCDLLAEHSATIKQGATLQSRLALSSIFQCVDKVFTDVVFPRIVSAFQRSQIKIQQATTPAHLEGIIETLDGMWEGRSGQEAWAHFRSTVVVQLVVGKLRMEMGMESISAEAVSVDSGKLAAFDVEQWDDTVKEVFSDYSYGLDVDDDEGCTQQEVTDLENLRVQQRLADVGDPSKINILYIFKQYGWANFVKEFKSFLRSLHVEVLGVPELVTQFQNSQPSPSIVIAASASSLPVSSTTAPVEEEEEDEEEREDDEDSQPASSQSTKNKSADLSGESFSEANVSIATKTFEQDDEVGYPDDDDDGDGEGGGDETDEEPETQPPEPNSARHRLKEASSNLSHAVHARADPLASALAETSPAARTVLAAGGGGPPTIQPTGRVSRSQAHAQQEAQAQGRKGKAAAKAKGGGEKGQRPKPPGPLVGKRDTSISVTFDSSQDSLETFEERPSLPAHSTRALPSFTPAASSGSQSASSSNANSRASVPGGAPTRKRKKWTHEEEQHVLAGADEFGVGRWAEIKKKYFMDSDRTSVDIKDKHRGLMVPGQSRHK